MVNATLQSFLILRSPRQRASRRTHNGFAVESSVRRFAQETQEQGGDGVGLLLLHPMAGALDKMRAAEIARDGASPFETPPAAAPQDKLRVSKDALR